MCLVHPSLCCRMMICYFRNSYLYRGYISFCNIFVVHYYKIFYCDLSNTITHYFFVHCSNVNEKKMLTKPDKVENAFDCKHQILMLGIIC